MSGRMMKYLLGGSSTPAAGDGLGLGVPTRPMPSPKATTASNVGTGATTDYFSRTRSKSNVSARSNLSAASQDSSPLPSPHPQDRYTTTMPDVQLFGSSQHVYRRNDAHKPSRTQSGVRAPRCSLANLASATTSSRRPSMDSFQTAASTVEDSPRIGTPDVMGEASWEDYEIFVDFDGMFNISRRADSSLYKKEMSVQVDGVLYQLVSYYSQWDTVNGMLVSPTRCLNLYDITLREELAASKDLQNLSRMEKFRMRMKGLSRRCQSEFMKNAIFLIFSWTDETHHPALLQRSQQMLFPIISSTDKYWEELSRAALFDGKKPHELADQMETLLSMLLWLSSGTDKPQYLNSSPGFTSLQNVSIYMEAFGVKEDPLEAFQPLDMGKLARSLELSPLFPKSENMDIQKIESWDAHMQHYLPIKRPRSLISTPAFTVMFAEEETIRMSVEQICETFPRFRRPELYEFMLLHQCSVDDTFCAMLQYWIKTKDGRRARVELMKVFQSPLAPEELALTLSVMAFLWCLSPLECEEDEFQSPPANLLSLAQLLSRPDTIGENEDLLLELHRSFRCAARSLDEEHFTSIIQLLARSFNVDGESPRSEELHMYFIQRLDGKGHGDATPTSQVDLDKLVEQSSLLSEAPE